MQSGKSVEKKLRAKGTGQRAKGKEEEALSSMLDTRCQNPVSSIQYPVSSIQHGVVLTFGVFDGVHIGHQVVVSHVVNRARALCTAGVVISFDPHPASSISGEAPPALTNTAKKIELLKMLGIDRIIVADFDRQFSRLSPEEFVLALLVGRFHTREIVVGYDCAFGKDRPVDVIEPYQLNRAVVSSTRIRTAISQGDLELARKLLGRLYAVSGLVVSGKGIGHRIGHATANLQLQKQVLPPSGVYAVKVHIGGGREGVKSLLYNGVLNMGIQPTFGKNEFRVEVHLLDFEGTLYGQDIEVLFVRNIRSEKTFASSKELAEQIRRDEAIAREILGARH
jgi:riboflavin kinase/FMN adenylyltransferase